MSPQNASSATTLTANTFTRAGYTFTGWNTAANGIGTSYANQALYPFAASVTLYAQWTTGFTTNVGTGANQRVYSAVTQSDGKIIVVGEFTSWNGSSADYVVRLNNDGTRDTSFLTGNFGYVANPVVRAAAVQADGKAILVGGFSSWNGQSVGRIVRLNADGSIDSAFRTNTGTGAGVGLRTVAVQSDGKILVGGDGLFNRWDGATVSGLVRLNSDGTRDLAFSTQVGTGGGIDGGVSTVRIQSDGKILVAGSFSQWNGGAVGRFIRLNSNGSRDESFASNIGSAANGWTEGVAIQSDGKILVAGSFSQWNGMSVAGLIRLNSDGTLDSTFVASIGGGPTREGSTGYAEQVAVQSDGQILVGGNFTKWGGDASIGLVRLNSNGTVATLFPDTIIDTESGNIVPSFTALPGGRVLVYGSLTSWKVQSVGRFIRLGESDQPD